MGLLRNQLYRAARDVGNVDAAERGFERGGAMGAAAGEARRYARRCVYRKVNGECTHRLCRALGVA